MTEEIQDSNVIKTDNISPTMISEEMRRSYLDYAMSVIVSRALPDARDGMKPVHRRIIYGMYENGYDSTKPYRKSARIVGDVMGKYHPHGDSSIYEAMVRMAQPFSMRLTLVDGQGNFGSMDGDGAAAMRYTEARLAKVATCLTDNLDEDTVDFMPNYDESLQEPTVLPARFPNLLVNGGNGIAVGMATNIPPHNLGEVIDACCAYIDNPEISIEDLIKIVPGPDFPTGGLILGYGGARQAYLTGRGSVMMRSKCSIEEIRKDKEAIIVHEVPYQVNKANLVAHIAELVKDKRIEGISDIRDESDRQGVRIVIEIKRDFQAEVILNQLYKYTELQTSWKALTSAHAKAQWIKQHAEDFEKLGVKIGGVVDAEQVFSKNTDAVVQSFVARAKAAARLAQLTEEYRIQMSLADKIGRANDAAQARHTVKAGDRVTQGFGASGGHTTEGGYEYVAPNGQWVYTDKGAAKNNSQPPRA